MRFPKEPHKNTGYAFEHTQINIFFSNYLFYNNHQ